MAAVVLDGAAIAREVYAGLAPRIAVLLRQGVHPGLAAVQVGEDPASSIYVRNKARACADAGLHSEVKNLDADCAEAQLLELIEELNRSERIHGIIVQLPLPRHLDANRVLQAISPHKDVDGFNWCNMGALMDGRPRFVPGTPLGVVAMLDHANVAIERAHAVVVGRSSIVGKPTALMLIARGATVTVCNSKTPDLAQHTARADILVAAAGKPGLITRDMVKSGAAVIDVGINRLPGGKLAGDVDFDGVRNLAAVITPVPGGVGRMTVAMLIANTVKAAELELASRAK